MFEVERKFDADAAFRVPELSVNGWSTGPAQTAELDATYHDTIDLRLASAHLTLRRRAGGKDPGWTLKVPAGTDREKITRPLGRGTTVPRALADLVAARTRGEALVPVARIRTTRMVTTLAAADGTPLVEVADDEVTGERLGGTVEVSRWREVEAELLDPAQQQALLVVAKRLRRAGATPSASASKLARTLGEPTAEESLPVAAGKPGRRPAAAAVAASLRAEVEGLVAADPGVRRGTDDAVHAMRVASRRLRSSLHTFRPLLDPAAVGDLDGELRWLAGVLGGERDREVLETRMRFLLDALPPELVLGPVRARLLDEELRGGQLKSHAAVLHTLRGPRYLALLNSLDALAAAPPVTDAATGPARVVLPPLLRRAWKRLDHRAAHALATGVDTDFHDTRKAAKQARYTADALTPALGHTAARVGQLAKDVQTGLGDHQDSVVARTLLRHLAVNETQGFTYGLLYAAERRRGQESLTAFTTLWAQNRRTGRRLLDRHH